MASQDELEDAFLQLRDSPSVSDHTRTSNRNPNARIRRRVANLYDAVAGRLSTTQPLAAPRTPNLDPEPTASSPDGYGLADSTLLPEEVLFRRRNAPERFLEKDIYFANEDLPGGGRDVLPESDLLKAVHAYSSRFYEALARRKGLGGFVGSRLVDERSMDETALLAFGILLEETGREVLGKRGDLVFTEGLVGAGGGKGTSLRGMGKQPVSRKDSIGFNDDHDFWKRRYPKRRKVNQSAEDA